jgi:probable F420-dependent oxidoreductase
MSGAFRVGVVFPQLEIEPEPVAIRDFAQGIEAMGYSHLVAYDHIVGADIKTRPDWNMPYTHESLFHEPLALFSFLSACTNALMFSTGVVVLPQRQTVLFGKQAANVDIFSGGRLRLGVGSGWNTIEYEALGVPFENRGARLDDQIRVLRRLWTETSFSEDSRFHKITAAGISPLPVQRPIPIWIGGISPASMRRAAQLGDGWLPVFGTDVAEEKVADLRQAVAAVGRDPDTVSLENIVFLGATRGRQVRSTEDAVADAAVWKQAGASGIAIHSMGMGLKGVTAHLELFGRIASMLALDPPPRMTAPRSPGVSGEPSPGR